MRWRFENAAALEGGIWQQSACTIKNCRTGGDDEASNPAPWTDDDEYELERLRTAPIDIGDTVYGRFEAQKKRDVQLAYQKMTPEEKSALQQNMTEIDAADADDDECAQPSLTPM